jgi:hypothetical protein
MNPPVIQTTYNFIPEIYNSTFKPGIFAKGVRQGFIVLFIKNALSRQKDNKACSIPCKSTSFRQLCLQIIGKQ